MPPPTRGTVLLAAGLLVALVSTRWIRLNISPSLPYGLYRLSAVQTPLTYGQLVVLPVPAPVRPWQSRWTPLLKPIAGLPGDTVCYRADVLSVNDLPYGPVLRTAQGKPVPHIAEGCFVVPAAYVFLASRVPRSLDSRYFGPVPVADLTAVAAPVVTW